MRNQTIEISGAYIESAFSSVGSKESEGPLSKYFDAHYSDDLLGQKTWEEAESCMIKNTLSGALTSCKKTSEDLDAIFAGDLLNQCMASSFGLKSFDIPLFGLYGACSTFVEGICLGAMCVGAGYAKSVGAITSSHFCSSQKQYRFPLEYGEVRTPTSQWTVTGSGCVIISQKETDIQISKVTVGKIVDLGVTDANNMGAAMAPSCADTLLSHFKSTNTDCDDYDCIVTGDLAYVGTDILLELMKKEGYDIRKKHLDCGSMIFDKDAQKVDAGGSGCGCIASVFSGYFYKMMKKKKLGKILLIGTGALMSPSSVLLGEPICGISHAAEIELSR
ncbi:MAG: stage V sporulation protein AD [Ruminococcaceae bacterium]|nr:stage V sporulation protein AD [Oscillospiraceae bacterium]